MKREPFRETLPPDKAAVQARFVALGWSQAEVARRIRKTPGLFSRWLRGLIVSSVIAERTERVLRRAEARRRRRADRAGAPNAA
jgi:transcriptional regulator with XRE-family HTH domain